jgi:hypothetical protein
MPLQVGGWNTANLTQQGYNADAETMLFASNRGEVFSLFENPLYQDQLAQWNLTTETAWHCAFGFLFRPTNKVAELFRNEISVLSDRRPLRIGVNIRVGDPEEIKINGVNPSKVFHSRCAS